MGIIREVAVHGNLRGCIRRYRCAWWPAVLLLGLAPAWLAWGASAKDRTVAWIGKAPVLLSQVQHDESLVQRNFAVLHHRPPVLPADKAALDALRQRMVVEQLRTSIQRSMDALEMQRLHVALSSQDIRDATAAFYSGPQAQDLLKQFQDAYVPVMAMIAEVYDKGRSPDDAYRELTSRAPWKSLPKQQWELLLTTLKTPQSRQEFLTPVSPSLVQRGALYAKLRWAMDAEIGKTNPDVARYAATEAGVWPNMTEHPVIPQFVIQARNQWWQKELVRVGVRIVDPELKGALPLTGPG